MKKTLFIVGSVETMLGVILWCVTDILKNMMTILGRIAYQLATNGNFGTGDYILFTTIPTILAITLIVMGVLQICISAKKER